MYLIIIDNSYHPSFIHSIDIGNLVWKNEEALKDFLEELGYYPDSIIWYFTDKSVSITEFRYDFLDSDIYPKETYTICK